MMPNSQQEMPQQQLASNHQKPLGKMTKVRRSRQPKNPQLSVARRNERERNRVKMVNNGFALLREHLPVEDLQDFFESGSDTPTPDGHKGASNSGKAKKYSKVQTLRAAIQRIKMLEELIRSTEPSFESINIMPTSNSNSYDEDPLSCGSSASPATTTTISSSTICQPNQQHPQYTNSQQLLDNTNQQQAHQLYTTNQQGQFIKLEPASYNSYSQQMPSPQDSQTSKSSQVHQQQQQQQQPQYSFQINSQTNSLDLVPSHTHLWIQQHQSSFMEQQQQQQQQQISTNNDWYQQQQQQQQQQFNIHHHQHHQQTHVESPKQSSVQPVWFQSSPSNQPQCFPQAQQHQISLYSQ